MRPIFKTKRNGTVTVKNRNFDFSAEAEKCVTETYRLQDGEYFVIPTANGNYFCFDQKGFEAYVTLEGEILRETEDEIEFALSWERPVEVLSLNIKNPDVEFRLREFSGCAHGALRFLEQNPQFMFILKQTPVGRLVIKYLRLGVWPNEMPTPIKNCSIKMPFHPEIANYIEGYYENE